jgi:hypothetical protein
MSDFFSSSFSNSETSMHFQFKPSSFAENFMFKLLMLNLLVGVCHQYENYFRLSMFVLFNFFFEKLFVCELLPYTILCCFLFTIELLIINLLQHEFIIKFDFFKAPLHKNFFNFSIFFSNIH